MAIDSVKSPRITCQAAGYMKTHRVTQANTSAVRWSTFGLSELAFEPRFAALDRCSMMREHERHAQTRRRLRGGPLPLGPRGARPACAVLFSSHESGAVRKPSRASWRHRFSA